MAFCFSRHKFTTFLSSFLVLQKKYFLNLTSIKMKNKSGKTTPTMNKFMKAIAAITLMTVVVCAAGCKKDDSTNITGNNGHGGGGVDPGRW